MQGIPKKSIREMIQINEQRPCSIPGCDRMRHSLNKYCGKHYYRHLYFGHHNARKIRDTEMEPERGKAKHVVELNADHSAIQRGIQYFDQWLENAGNDVQGTLYADLFKQMHSESITGKDLFTEAVAITLFNERHPGEIPGENPEPFMIALGLCVGCLKKSPLRDELRHKFHMTITAKNRKALGRIVWGDLGKVLITVANAIVKDAQKKDLQWDLSQVIKVS